MQGVTNGDMGKSANRFGEQGSLVVCALAEADKIDRNRYDEVSGYIGCIEQFGGEYGKRTGKFWFAAEFETVDKVTGEALICKKRECILPGPFDFSKAHITEVESAAIFAAATDTTEILVKEF